jgi:hypothetical protein
LNDKSALNDLKAADKRYSTTDTSAPNHPLSQIDAEHGQLTITDGSATVSKITTDTTNLSSTTTVTPGTDVTCSVGQPEIKTAMSQFPSSKDLLNPDDTEKVQYGHKVVAGAGSYMHPHGAPGKPASVTSNNNGIIENDKYDANKKLVSKDFTFPDKHRQHDAYDANGKRTSSDLKFADGTTQHVAYDSNENVKTADVRRADGTTSQHLEVGANGQTTIASYDTHGKLTTVDIARRDKSTEHQIYDANEKLISSDETWADGGKSCRTYDPATGLLLSDYIHYADNTISNAEFDPVTGNLKSQDIVQPDGSRTHTDYDPVTGKEIPETVAHAVGGIVDDVLGFFGF